MTPDELLERARSVGLKAVVGLRSAPQPYVATSEMCPIILVEEGVFIGIARPEFRSEGYRPPSMRIDTRKSRKADETRVDTFLRTAARLQAREAAVAGHEDPHVLYPPWSFRADGLALAMAAAAGIDLAECTRPATWRRTVEPYNGHLATPSSTWDWARETTYVRGDRAGREGTPTDAELRGDRLVMSLLNPGGGAYLREETARTILHIEETLPETMMVALAGRPVGDVLDVACDHRIVRAHRDDAGTALIVRGPGAPVQAAPDGVDTWWLNV